MSTKLGRVLVIDDEAELMTALCEALNEKGYEALGFSSSAAALRALKERDFDLLLIDLMMPDMDGIEFLKEAKKIDLNAIGIIMTGHGTVQTAVEAMKEGAFDYILKPFKINVLLAVMLRAMEMRRLRNENLQLRESMAIYNITTAVSFTLDVNVILNKIADAVIDQCGADEVSIMLPASTEDELYVAVVRGEQREDILGQRIPVQEGIVPSYEDLLQQGGGLEPRFAPVKLRPEIKSSISIPLLVGGKCVGVLNANSKKRNSFAVGKVKALKILASTAASALENARLYAELQEAEQNYRSIFENATEGIFQVAPDGRYCFVNPSMARIMGYDKPEELMSLSADANYEWLLGDQEERQCIERRIYRWDGSVIWVSESVRAVRDNNGRTLFFEGTMEDITKRREAEEALRESEERYRRIVETASEGILVIDGSCSITFANKKMAEMLACTSEEMIGKSLYDFIDNEWMAKADDYLKRDRQGIMGLNEFKLRRKDGKELWTVLSTNSLYELNGQYSGVLAMVTDITERKHLEKEMVRLDRLHLVGEMAAGLAHEVRNPMTTVKGLLQLYRDKKDFIKYKESFDLMVDELNRVNSIITEFLTLAKNKKIDLKKQSLNKILEDIYPLVQADAIKNNKYISLELEDLPKLPLDEKEIRQVILNLVRNGLEAMPKKDTLTIRTYLDVGEVVLAVRNHGPEIPPEVLEKIGTPFFTTKENGTGLGMAVCYSIASRHNASIRIETGPAETTVFVCFKR